MQMQMMSPPGSDQIRPGRSGQVPLIKPVRRQVSIEQAWFGLVWFGKLLVLAGGNKQAIAASSPHTQLGPSICRRVCLALVLGGLRS